MTIFSTSLTGSTIFAFLFRMSQFLLLPWSNLRSRKHNLSPLIRLHLNVIVVWPKVCTRELENYQFLRNALNNSSFSFRNITSSVASKECNTVKSVSNFLQLLKNFLIAKPLYLEESKVQHQNHFSGNIVFKFHLSLITVNLRFNIRDFELSLFQMHVP